MQEYADKTFDAQQRFWDQVTKPSASEGSSAKSGSATNQAQRLVTSYFRSVTKMGLQLSADVWRQNLDLGKGLWNVWKDRKSAPASEKKARAAK